MMKHKALHTRSHLNKLRGCYAIELDAFLRSSRYPTARRTVQMTNKVRIV